MWIEKQRSKGKGGFKKNEEPCREIKQDEVYHMDLIHILNKQFKKIVSKLDEIEGRKFKKQFEAIETLAESKRWKDVLNKISDYAPHQYGYNLKNHSLLKKLKMSSIELDLCISFLEDNELIVHIPKKDGYGHIGLTKKGFDVSFEIEKINLDKKFRRNTIIISVSAILVSIVLVVVNIYKIIYPSCI